MAKKKGKGRGNPGTMTVTNPKKKKAAKKRAKKRNPAKKKQRRNNKKSFIARSFDRLGKDAMLALPNLGGRYVGEGVSILGAQYLGGMLGSGASTAGQVLTHLGLVHFAPKTPGWNQLRIGLISEAIHEVALGQLGIDVPGMVLDLFVEEEAGAAGLGALQDVRTVMSNRMAMAPDYSI